ncbi:hypothetical protein BpHYR1_013675 [Brachionus plicatilis]|uniref:Uncharacterized protein n=1 Tax=Brachionus plicatilis TaxID=10195 RepID=A0A3M7SXP0_BRAPC|nr:hypothetical protein BpHYR1_013675 [Brachionus plicatilis]
MHYTKLNNLSIVLLRLSKLHQQLLIDLHAFNKSPHAFAIATVRRIKYFTNMHWYPSFSLSRSLGPLVVSIVPLFPKIPQNSKENKRKFLSVLDMSLGPSAYIISRFVINLKLKIVL